MSDTNELWLLKRGYWFDCLGCSRRLFCTQDTVWLDNDFIDPHLDDTVPERVLAWSWWTDNHREAVYYRYCHRCRQGVIARAPTDLNWYQCLYVYGMEQEMFPRQRPPPWDANFPVAPVRSSVRPIPPGRNENGNGNGNGSPSGSSTITPTDFQTTHWPPTPDDCPAVDQDAQVATWHYYQPSMVTHHDYRTIREGNFFTDPPAQASIPGEEEEGEQGTDDDRYPQQIHPNVQNGYNTNRHFGLAWDPDLGVLLDQYGNPLGDEEEVIYSDVYQEYAEYF